ncbi:MAG TPA: THUMP domain-containing protein [Gemmatimonadaceae bacterium]
MGDAPSAESAPPAASTALALFAMCAPGLERFVSDELRALGAHVVGAEPGGVSFAGDLELLYRANLWLRTAGRVTVRLAEFRARAFGELERRARQLPWERFVGAGRAIRLRVTCRKSRLYHSDAVAQRVADAIRARVGGGEDAVGVEVAGGAGGAADDDDAGAAQLIIVRLLHDRCTLSVDASGALLHARGYRLATARAPLRETLAAALLAASGWDPAGVAPLVDPMCGSGTIAIEAAMQARAIAPGLDRRFAFTAWPDYDAERWTRLVDEARARIRPRAAAPILASDRDAGAIEAAAANAERAGVAADIALSRRAISAIEPPAASAGWIVTNPPYGVRVGEPGRLRDLYAQLGHVARRRCPGWTVALLSPDPRLESHARIPFETVATTRNGGIAVRMVVGKVG